MRATYRLVNGKLPLTQKITSLDDQQAQQTRRKVAASIREISSCIEDLVKIDGSSNSTPYSKPSKPEEPSFLGGLWPPTRAAFNQKKEDYESRNKDWERGGKDLAEDPGTVVSTADINRFDANIEAQFEPASLFLPTQEVQGAEFELPRGIQSVIAEFDNSSKISKLKYHTGSRAYSRTRDYHGTPTTERHTRTWNKSLKVSVDESKEVYTFVKETWQNTTRYVTEYLHHGFYEKPENGEPTRIGQTQIEVQIDKKKGTLTYTCRDTNAEGKT